MLIILEGNDVDDNNLEYEIFTPPSFGIVELNGNSVIYYPISNYNGSDNFSYKARSIHYNNKKNKKGIYGNATIKEVKELKEEGIETEMIPWIEDKDN